MTKTRAKKTSKKVATTAAKVAAKNKRARASAKTPAIPTQTTPLQSKTRRAIFVDVENISSESELLKVFEHLRIDRAAVATEIIGMGNWKALGTRFARTLGKFGARMVHTAPDSRVRDWSDLWIAVNVGIWLAHAAPGDILDIVSDDKAFDAAADAAAAAGVTFQRLSFRNLPGRPKEASKEASKDTAAREGDAPRPSRRSRRRRKRSGAAPSQAVTVQSAASSNAASTDDDGNHAASQEHIREALKRLAGETGGWVNLDTLANTLRSEGFTRPPGSPRLMTRLRRMKDLEVRPNGMLRLIDAAAE